MTGPSATRVVRAAPATPSGEVDPAKPAEQVIAELERALVSSRTIGIAVGILAERHGLSPDHAFELLVQASQHGNRKVRDIAAEMVAQAGQPEPARSQAS